MLRAGEWFEPLGARVEGLMVLARADAEDAGMARVVVNGPLHLPGRRLADAPPSGAEELDGLGGAARGLADGAVVAGAGAGAMVLTDPMVDARGGGLTLGLGLVDDLAVVPHFGDVHEDAHGEKLHRSVALAPAALPVVGIPERTALIRGGTGRGARGGGDRPCSSAARRPRGSLRCRAEPRLRAGARAGIGVGRTHAIDGVPASRIRTRVQSPEPPSATQICASGPNWLSRPSPRW